MAGDPEPSYAPFAGELDHDRTRLGVLDNVCDQFPASRQQQLVERRAESVLARETRAV